MSKFIELPLCKSVLNRYLILKYLYDEFTDTFITDKMADDTVLLNDILYKDIPGYCDCKNAGTVFRFVLALSSLSNKQRVIGGSERMKERPCKDLVDALQILGAEIEYLDNEGYPPVKIISPIDKNNYPKIISIDSTVSSQFISAVMMIAPSLADGLTINIEGKRVSFSYIQMTSKIMNKIGLSNYINENQIFISPFKGNVNLKDFTFERDWSSAAFWVTILSAHDEGKIILKDLKVNSMQGDEALLDYLQYLNIDYIIDSDSIILTKPNNKVTYNKTLEVNLKDSPDLFPALAVAFAINNLQVQISGLSHLIWKESNRVLAVVNNLKLLGYNIDIFNEDEVLINRSNNKISDIKGKITLNSHDDHRIAMSFAIFEKLNKSITVTDKSSVIKSYPDFFYN